jgi:hypothetical protein
MVHFLFLAGRCLTKVKRKWSDCMMKIRAAGQRNRVVERNRAGAALGIADGCRRLPIELLDDPASDPFAP